jgi:hypothetical protein
VIRLLRTLGQGWPSCGVGRHLRAEAASLPPAPVRDGGSYSDQSRRARAPTPRSPRRTAPLPAPSCSTS